jgi:VWFA-related protein
VRPPVLSLAPVLALFLALPGRPAPPLLIEVPVLVLDHQGLPVLQLNSDLFRLRDNGRRQRILKFQGAERPVSVALVVDTRDAAARRQAARSAAVVAAMLMGEGGEAAIYTAGAEAAPALAFTPDQTRVARVLRHLAAAPVPPLGASPVSDAARMALLALTHQPAGRARAVVIVAPQAARGESAAGELMRQAGQQAVNVFWLSPGPELAAKRNPDTVAYGGSGQGSQRDPNVLPTGALPGRPGYTSTDVASVNLTPVAKEAVHLAAAPVLAVVAAHAGDVAYATGGLAFSPGGDVAFDRELASIGGDLRAEYRLYFAPDALGPAGSRHLISVRVLPMPGVQQVARVSYRRTYFAPSLTTPRPPGRR